MDLQIHNEPLLSGQRSRQAKIDGDAFTVAARGQEQTIRIACIDALMISQGNFDQKSKNTMTGMLRLAAGALFSSQSVDCWPEG